MTASYIFISYARKDRPQVEALSETLRQIGHQVWLDESLAGGATWWAEILHQIEQCHIFLYVLSHSSLKSEACTAEKGYAEELGKPLLPVKVESVGAASLPADLAQLHIIDYTNASREGLIRLVHAIQNMPQPKAVSPPLEKPPVPVSYLSQLGRQARSAASADEQILVIYRLSLIAESDEDDEKRAEALALIDDMSRRHDLWAEAERQIRVVKERVRVQPPGLRPPVKPQHPQAASLATDTAARREPGSAEGAQMGSPPIAATHGVGRQVSQAQPHNRPPWLLPVVFAGAVILVALAVLFWAMLG